MLDGKKGVAQRIVYDAFDIIKEKEQKLMVLELEWQQQAEEKYLLVAVKEEEKFYLPNKNPL